jgi:hypothetical protein
MTSSTDAVADQPVPAGPQDPTVPTEPVDPAAGRMTGLAERVHRLRTSASAGGFDRWLLIAGALLMPLGIVFILLGWAGAARTPLQFEQTDYLISGGILGLALVVAGGFSYFAYWQTVRLREARTQSANLSRAIGRLETLLTSGAASAATGIDVPRPVYVATASGTIFHRQDCAAVAGRDDLSEIDPDTTTLSACRICAPLDPR